MSSSETPVIGPPTRSRRVRTVEGSCWPCRKRRIKCSLEKPGCKRCAKVGARCNYDARLIKWSTKPTATAPAVFQAIPRNEQLTSCLAVYERRALDYFHNRFWPLLSTASEPCAPPIYVALEHRVVLLATCVLADSHRVLQDGRNSQRMLGVKRLDCFAAVRGELDGFSAKARDGALVTLLLAVLLLYFHDGFLESHRDSASTSSHHAGVRAIVQRLGGLKAVMDKAPEPMHMLLSEFASTDVTTAMLAGREPCLPPAVWDDIDQRAVWWRRDRLGRHSLASVLQLMSDMAFYRAAASDVPEHFSLARVRAYQAALQPVHAAGQVAAEPSGAAAEHGADGDQEAVDGHALVRAFQHTALIYLYRAVCGLPTLHPLVQQHVLSCLDCIAEMQRPSKVLNCVIFPLCVAGAHVQTARHRRDIFNMLDLIYDDMRFASVHCVSLALGAIWKADDGWDKSWDDLFSGLSPHALVL